MIDSVAIVSGGLDSVTLLHYLVKNVGLNPAVLTFKYGQKHSKEIECAKTQVTLLSCDEHLIIDLSLMSPLFSSSALISEDIAIPNIDMVLGDPQPITYVPNRNMIFLALAAAFAETHGLTDVYYGAQSHDLYSYWDTTHEFLERLNVVFQLNRKVPIKLHAPFVDFFKSDILRVGLEMDVDYGKTWSCYEGDDIACGRCPTCAERLKAFEEVGILDPLLYASAA